MICKDKGNWKKLTIFGLSFGFFAVCLYFVVGGEWAVYANRANAVTTRLVARYYRLKYREVNGDEPGTLPACPNAAPISPGQFYFSDIKAYYYPRAWDKPGSILLKRSLGKLDYVVFGNGSLAAVTYFSYKGTDPNTTVRLIETTAGEPFHGYSLLTLVCAGMAILLAIWLTCKHTGPESVRYGQKSQQV